MAGSTYTVVGIDINLRIGVDGLFFLLFHNDKLVAKVIASTILPTAILPPGRLFFGQNDSVLP
jgi:hypothetical protein